MFSVESLIVKPNISLGNAQPGTGVTVGVGVRVIVGVGVGVGVGALTITVIVLPIVFDPDILLNATALKV